MGNLTDCPWLFRKLSDHLGLQAFQALGRLPWPATSEADSRKATQPQQPPPRTTTGWPTPGSRPRKAAQGSECLEARRPDNFFRRTRGSRLGYPWPFTPTLDVGVGGKKLCVPTGCIFGALAAVSSAIAVSGAPSTESGLSTEYCCVDSRSCFKSGLGSGLSSGRTSDSGLEAWAR